jgi:hypothetical protein
MKAFNPPIAIDTVAPLMAKTRSVVSPPRAICPPTTYASVLEGPLALLVVHAMDRTEVQSIAVLGYN